MNYHFLRGNRNAAIYCKHSLPALLHFAWAGQAHLLPTLCQKVLQRCSLSCYLQVLSILSPFHTAFPLASYPCSFSPQSFSVSYQQPQLPSLLLSTCSVTRNENLDQFLHLSSSHPSGHWQLSEGGVWEPTWARTHHCYYPYFPYFV